MIKNYIKITLRNFKANKFYSLINVFGMSIGFTSFILILLFVTDEMSYDSFHKDKDQIYFVGVERKFGGEFKKSIITQYPVGKTAVEEVVNATMYATITPPNPARISKDGIDFTSGFTAISSSPDFFSMFSFPLKLGDKKDVLQEPGTVVISSKIAEQFFPGENPIGKTLTIDRYGISEYTVTGVTENLRKNTYLDFDVVFSIQGLSSTRSNSNSWGASMYNTFIKLEGEGPIDDHQEIANQVFDTHLGEARAPNTNYLFVPITELYLSDLITTDGFKGNFTYIYIFSSIALFILILANINYINLSTAKGMQRAKEVGVRKVLGAKKSQLIKQFLGESLFLSILSLGFALLLCELFLPGFNQFFDKSLNLSLIENYQFLILLLLITLGIGALTGLYPALFLSGFKTATVLKGYSSNKIGGINLRKTLVVFQFGISTVLMVCTIVVLSQMDFLLTKDLGFNKENALYIPLDQVSDKNALESTIRNHPSVLSASYTNGIPGRFYFSMSDEFDPQRPEEQISTHVISTDEEFDKTMELEIVAGRYFDENRSDDLQDAIVINEAMQRRMGWLNANEAIGQTLSNENKIIGVVKDFHFQTLRADITPVIISSIRTPSSTFSGGELLLIRYEKNQLETLLPYLQGTWEGLSSGLPFDYGFLDDQMDQLYETDKKLGTIFSLFAGIGILISCMGLLGLTAFAAQLRTREIGIRKVLGASVSSILTLLSFDFLKLVFIGFVVAIPFSWYVMNKWLSDFAYRIEIGFGVFLIAGIAAFLISTTTTSWQSIKAATANPVESLKNE
ncbi:MAG: ABC transporter permease [Balneolales bacterium]|nr:ABC transporter permease [Balneolales bacterium]